MDTRPQWRENRKPQQVSRRFGPGRGALERSLRLPAGRRRDGGKGFLGVDSHAALPYDAPAFFGTQAPRPSYLLP